MAAPMPARRRHEPGTVPVSGVPATNAGAGTVAGAGAGAGTAAGWPADHVERRSVASLTPYANNARTHSDAQIAQIAASIQEWGWTVPVLIDEDGTLIAGHGRVLAAKKLGLAEVPVMVARGWTEAQKRAYVIADNKLALNAGWDEGLLRDELLALQDVDFGLDLIGFDAVELDAIFAEKTTGQVDEDEIPAPSVPVSRAGDLWLLGNHRLVCGSCTDLATVERVIGRDAVDLCLTDPPYGLGAKKKSGKNHYAEYEDTRENLLDLAAKWLPIARKISPAVVFSPGVTNQWVYPEPNWVICWFYGGGQLRSPWGFNCWQPFICYGKDPSLANGNGARPDAIDMNVPANAGDLDHPCPKPVKLWEWMMARLIFKPSAVLFEPFSGSGTTLIAAEKLGHKVRAVELTPAYVDLAVRRWEAFAGRVATLEATGQTFSEVREERTAAHG